MSILCGAFSKATQWRDSMQLTIGSTRKKTLRHVVRSILSDSKKRKNHEYYLACEDTQDTYDVVLMFNKEKSVSGINKYSIGGDVMLKNGCSIHVMTTRLFLEQQRRFYRRKERSIWMVCDFFIRMYEDYPILNLGYFNDLNIYHYYCVTPEKSDHDAFISMRDEYNRLLFKRNVLSMGEICDAISRMYAVYGIKSFDKVKKSDVISLNRNECVKNVCKLCKSIFREDTRCCLEFCNKLIANNKCPHYAELFVQSLGESNDS